MIRGFYHVYKLPIWVFCFTMIALVTLISCHNATVNPPTMDMILKSIDNKSSYNFLLDGRFSGKMYLNKNKMSINFSNPENIENITFEIDDKKLKLKYDDINTEYEMNDLLENNKLNLIKSAFNSLFIDTQKIDISRWNDTVKVKSHFNNSDYKFLFDENLDLKQIKCEKFNLKLDKRAK